MTFSRFHPRALPRTCVDDSEITRSINIKADKILGNYAIQVLCVSEEKQKTLINIQLGGNIPASTVKSL